VCMQNNESQRTVSLAPQLSTTEAPDESILDASSDAITLHCTWYTRSKRVPLTDDAGTTVQDTRGAPVAPHKIPRRIQIKREAGQ